MAGDSSKGTRTGLGGLAASPSARRAPPGFATTQSEARHSIRAGIKEAETTGLSGSALLATLMSETLPRLVNAYGQANAALILMRIAYDIRTGAAPNTTRQ